MNLVLHQASAYLWFWSKVQQLRTLQLALPPPPPRPFRPLDGMLVHLSMYTGHVLISILLAVAC